MAEDRDILSAFTELKLPIHDKLSLSLALRGDKYEDIRRTWNPQYGVVWRPAQDWLLRASYGTSFRPPSLFELHAPRRDVIFVIADPRRGGAVSNVLLTVGGNPDLKVVTARSLTSGFVFTPKDSGMRFAGSYWHVAMDSRIMVPPFSEIVRSEADFPDRIIRSAPTAEDIAAGRPGAIQSLILTRLNYGTLETSGIDFDIAYPFDTRWGSFEPTLNATWVHDYSVRDVISPLPVNRVGIANAAGTVPEWRVVGTVTWERGDFGASATGTYTPRYQDANPNGPVDRPLRSRALMDLQVWWELGTVFGEGSLFSGTKLTAGALNLFDKQPDFSEAGLMVGYDLSQIDMTRRFTYLRLSKSF